MVALAAAILAAFTPPAVDRILDRDWCSPAAYAQARRVPHLDLTARRNLFEAAALAREHPRGCRLAESAARRRGQRLPGPRKLHCARPLPLPAHGARHDAARAAAAATGRGLRPIVVSFGGRGAQVRNDCGALAARRSVVVGMSLTALLPSASLSTSIVAVARFRGSGWRVWDVLH